MPAVADVTSWYSTRHVAAVVAEVDCRMRSSMMMMTMTLMRLVLTVKNSLPAVRPQSNPIFHAENYDSVFIIMGSSTLEERGHVPPGSRAPQILLLPPDSKAS